jgi:hypothetical protein
MKNIKINHLYKKLGGLKKKSLDDEDEKDETAKS